mmetsp:Transcript_25790/g.38100  ORF Transcript_25790/g.38100 Transcript_25790/m.38100 type:complete len:230 (+) Transcript_25790:196-885(+)
MSSANSTLVALISSANELIMSSLLPRSPISSSSNSRSSSVALLPLPCVSHTLWMSLPPSLRPVMFKNSFVDAACPLVRTLNCTGGLPSPFNAASFSRKSSTYSWRPELPMKYLVSSSLARGNCNTFLACKGQKFSTPAGAGSVSCSAASFASEPPSLPDALVAAAESSSSAAGFASASAAEAETVDSACSVVVSSTSASSSTREGGCDCESAIARCRGYRVCGALAESA